MTVEIKLDTQEHTRPFEQKNVVKIKISNISVSRPIFSWDYLFCVRASINCHPFLISIFLVFIAFGFSSFRFPNFRKIINFFHSLSLIICMIFSVFSSVFHSLSFNFRETFIYPFDFDFYFRSDRFRDKQIEHACLFDVCNFKFRVHRCSFNMALSMLFSHRFIIVFSFVLYFHRSFLFLFRSRFNGRRKQVLIQWIRISHHKTWNRNIWKRGKTRRRGRKLKY